jgi:5-formyltetrahydrofolate cyclo-ligase
MTSLHLEKSLLRQKCLAARQAIPGAGEALRDVFLKEFEPPPDALIAGFWPMGEEINTVPLLHALHARGYDLALPVTLGRGEPLVFRSWSPGAAMARGPLGTQYPAEDDPVTPNWLIVPLLAFDRSGGRLGYGGGYYDRTLALLGPATAIGVGYAMQEIPKVPTGPHDIRMHAIVTDRGFFRA